jgi:hypothetical protein
MGSSYMRVWGRVRMFCWSLLEDFERRGLWQVCEFNKHRYLHRLVHTIPLLLCEDHAWSVGLSHGKMTCNSITEAAPFKLTRIYHTVTGFALVQRILHAHPFLPGSTRPLTPSSIR